MRIEYHRTLIADAVRNDVIFRALQRVIVPGETVVADIGAGTGLLGLMAAKLGAREVFFYEAAEVAAVAEAVIAGNGVKNGHLMPCHSMEMDEPPQVDVVVSETLGNYAFEEDIIATLNDAVERHLRPGGMVLPVRVRQFMAPVTSPRLDTELRVWAKAGTAFGLDLSRAERMSLNNAYVRRLLPEDLGGFAPQMWDEAMFTGGTAAARGGSATWTLPIGTLPSGPLPSGALPSEAWPSACRVYGLSGWWEADFGEGLCLSTGPGAPPTHWEQLYFPLLEPIELAAGQTFFGEIGSHSDPESGTHLAWAAELRDAEGRPLVRHEMDLDQGYLP